MDFCFHILCFLLCSWLALLLYVILLSFVEEGSHLREKGLQYSILSENECFMSSAMESLRQLVNSKTWDYCVLWKLSEDQRFLEFMDSCCAGSEGSMENGTTVGEELLFPCRDMMFQHPRTRSCELLAQLPSSHPLDGINMEILISNQPKWLNFSNVSDLNVNEVTVGTKLLIPIPGGLAELFAAKQINEDQNVIDYVMTQCTTLMDQAAISSSSNAGPNFAMNMNMINELQSNPTLSDQNNANHILSINIESQSSMNFLQQFNYVSETNKISRNDYLDGANDSFQAENHHQLNSFKSLSENGFEELMNNANSMHNLHVLDHSANEHQQVDEKGPMPKHEMSRADSVSDSDPLDDDDDPKYHRRKPTKGPQSKNLVAERKRRKKLNERLYHLRSLVPNISKLDRASILGDAIKYVQELQKEEKDLQIELARNSDDEDHNNDINIDHPQHVHHQLHQMNFSPEVQSGQGPRFGPDFDHEKPRVGFHMGGASENLKRSQDFESANDKAQQMEVQVEVAQLEGNDFFVKVFGEQKKGGFVRLMEALHCLGLEIINVNMTSCISLVSYVFIVKKRDSENVQAEYLRDSLLEATRNQAGFWSEMAKASSENGSGIDHRHQNQNQHYGLQHHIHSPHIGPFHNHFHHLSN